LVQSGDRKPSEDEETMAGRKGTKDRTVAIKRSTRAKKAAATRSRKSARSETASANGTVKPVSGSRKDATTADAELAAARFRNRLQDGINAAYRNATAATQRVRKAM
jgi:hypothetical protein